jgi:hypothetical protein
MIKAEGALIGWGFILVTPQGVQGPPMQDHCRCPNGHPRRGLEKLIRKKHRNISRSVAYSVDIFIHPKFLDRSTVILDPDAQQLSVSSRDVLRAPQCEHGACEWPPSDSLREADDVAPPPRGG